MTQLTGADHHELVAFQFPLWGSRLIEASAGTGKTWTIAALYVRLVLGHGSGGGTDNGFSRPLMPSEILVMTFTKAATRELSERIRARLIEAARCFRGEQVVDPKDAFLCDLLADYPQGVGRNQAAWRLAMAAEGMDDAGVHTIDAWCQRMLREHAFDSGSLFDEELVTDEARLLTQACQDYWRRECYPLDAQTLDSILDIWKDIAALSKDASQLIKYGLDARDTDQSLSGMIDQWMSTMQTHLADREQHIETMRAWLLEEITERKAHWHGGKLKEQSVLKWFDALRQWAELAHPLSLPDIATGSTRMTPSGLREARTKGAPTDFLVPESFNWFETLVRQYEANPAVPMLRQHAAAHVANRVALLKRQGGTFGFADMLERLHTALIGPHGARLRERMLTQYPVALIDEFQDTSPIQYSIFDQVYQTQAHSRDSALLLIGDPKQSIYGFRGADIYSYMQARQATQARHYVLKKNYRSTQKLVDAVNHCFLQAESSQAEGAFLFKKPGEASQNPLPFVDVQAHGRHEQFVTTDGPVVALTLVHDTDLQNADSACHHFSERCAEQIVTWLNDPHAGFEQKDGQLERVRPRDIAILVRTGKEAAVMRRSLQRRGVASVYLSDKDSVFQSEEAADLVHWLRGVSHPQDASLARAALATRTIGLSLDELGFLATNDEAFDERSMALHALHTIWQSQGVLAMLRQSLHRFELAQAWLTQVNGERRLTNFLHLAELLQVASSSLDGEQALIRWLSNQIAENEEQSDEQVIRLESDADLIKVVTVHKSKGLEYPVVCLPFATSFRAVSRRFAKSVSLPDEHGRREVVLDLSDDDVKVADKERLREDVRLLYVALTRARHALWLGFATVKVGTAKECQSHKSAVGYLFGGPEVKNASEWSLALQQLAAGNPDIALRVANTSTACTPLNKSNAASPLRDVLPYSADFDRDWSVASYSRITRDAKTQGSALTAMQGLRAADDEWTDATTVAGTGSLPLRSQATGSTPITQFTPPSQPIRHSFKRGPITGNFLHDQLEWLATEGFVMEGSPATTERLRLRCERAGHVEQAPALVQWLQEVVSVTLPGPNAALQAVGQARAELEFWLPTDRLDTRRVDHICQTHILAGVARPPLKTTILHGMLMGFADLVFEHEGRFWVLDYKSNHLGSDDESYDRHALEMAMAEHRYDVQAAIYTLALHRLLKSRMGAAYDPAQHLGGAIYLFLRGIHGPCQGTCVIAPSLAGLTELDAMLGGSTVPA